MENLSTIKNLTTQEISDIMNAARNFEDQVVQNSIISNCKGKNLALLFFENSTRTRFSFEAAAHNLGLRIFNFNEGTSSLSKGESVLDTIRNLAAIGINAMVIRSADNSFIENILKNKVDMKFINAGEGNYSHPTQALLDFYTIKKYLGEVKGKKVVIVGDIVHSRVAKSNIELLSRFGAEICCVAPKYFQDSAIKNVNWSDNLKESLKNADVTMCLRVQKERIEGKIPISDYVKSFRVDSKNINSKTLLMHPGPVNRDIEMTSELLDSTLGQTILEQAKNGVYVRMAVLDMILGGNNVKNC
jgi:aspartate carbamoyltransferase catalytic subunit